MSPMLTPMLPTMLRWGPATRIGLVLGAGGLSGEAFHRGVIRGLHDGAGWDARDAAVIVGTSAGSLIGASIRAPQPRTAVTAGSAAVTAGSPDPTPWLPPPGPGAYEYVKAALRRPWTLRPTAVLSTLLPAGSRSTEVVQEGVRRRFADEWPAKPLLVVATRRYDGKRVVFGQPDQPMTDVATAVGASCAVPGFFRPVFVDGTAYIDGALRSPTNADVLASAPVDVVVVSSPMSIATTAVRPRADVSLRLMWHRRLMRELRGLRARGVQVITFEPDVDVLARLRLHPTRIRDIDEVEELAREMTLRRLDSAHAAVAWHGDEAA